MPLSWRTPKQSQESILSKPKTSVRGVNRTVFLTLRVTIPCACQQNTYPKSACSFFFKITFCHSFWNPLSVNFTFPPPARLLDFNIALRASFTFFFSSSPPRQLLIAVGTAGPQLPAPDPSGRRLTSTTISRYQWALLDLNRGPLESSGHRWTSTGDLPSPVGNAGPQPWSSLCNSYQILPCSS